MNEPLIVVAKESDLRALAASRYSDDPSQQLYVNLASSGAAGCWVARDVDEPVGIAFAHALETEWFVSELFVQPSFRGAGLGWKLLRQATADSGDASLGGLVDADDVASLAFFLRRGMGLHVPVLRVTGEIPREDELAQMVAGDYRFTTVPMDPEKMKFEINGLDREVRGTARPNDHIAFSQLAKGTAFVLNDEIVGYTYVWPDGRIGPLVAASGAYLAQFFGYALLALRREYQASWCMALVPGSNVRVMRAAVRMGLTLDQVRIFATDQPQIDLSRYVGFHALAF